MRIPAWCEAYLLLDVASLGPHPCWDLVRRVLRDQASLDLPAHTEVDHRDVDACACAVTAAQRGPAWRRVARAEARALDVVVMLRVVEKRPAPVHVGVLVAPGLMLHAEEGRRVAAVALAEGRFAGIVDSIWRHAGLEGAA